MDFSSLNPTTSNALNLAARHNNVTDVKRLLTKMNPNCIDNRGWTCLHEAAAKDCYESMMLILNHPDCRPLAETHEGHTALYIACQYSTSLRTIQALLDNVPDIVNYCSTEQVTPLHIACRQGRIDCIELLIKYGAKINVQDFDGDTPLHDATVALPVDQLEVLNILLHANANPEIKNESSYTPLHLACYKECLKSVQYLVPFVADINTVTCHGDTALSVAVIRSNEKIVEYLLENDADPNIENCNGDIALASAIKVENVRIFKILLDVTDFKKLDKAIITLACKSNYFSYEIVSLLLTHLGQEFFEYDLPCSLQIPIIGNYKLCYLVQAPLNIFLNICDYVYTSSPDKFRELFYLFLMKGLSVNALLLEECPPLISMQLYSHKNSFKEVFKILMDHGCNVDYSSSASSMGMDMYIPDAFLISLQNDPSTTPIMLPFSLQCDPDLLLKFAHENKLLYKIHPQVYNSLISMTGLENTKISAKCLYNTVFPLKHLTRLRIRHQLRKRKGIEKSTKQYIKTLNEIKLPQSLINYLRYC